MYASLADRSSRKLIDRLAKIDLLLIDEMGYLNLRPEQSNIFFKLMEERYNRKASERNRSCHAYERDLRSRFSQHQSYNSTSPKQLAVLAPATNLVPLTFGMIDFLGGAVGK